MSKHISVIVKEILTACDEACGMLGIHNFDSACFSLRCQGVHVYPPANLSWLYETPVAELESYGIFATVDRDDNQRAFYLDAAMRDDDQASLDER